MLGMRIAALLRTNGWVLNLVFIALAAYFLAGAANAVVARSIRVVPTADDKIGVSPSAAPGGPVRQGFTAIAERNLFGIKRENLRPTPEVAAAPTANPNDVRGCTLQMTVRATLVADNAPEWSMAVLFVNNEAGVFSINAGTNHIVDDATLVSVEERAVVVRRRDHFERCFAEGEGSPVGGATAMAPAPVAASTSAPADPVAGDMTGVTKVSETQYNVDRSEVEKAMNNLSEVATQARIVPNFKNGKASGFKMFSIKPGSIYSKIGLQNGDVIQKINGYEMSSPDKALEIYQKLKEANTVTIELQRRGQDSTLNYTIGG
jgi:general secretion pathway protein C